MKEERYEVRFRKAGDGWDGPGRLLCCEASETAARRRRDAWAQTKDVIDCFIVDRKTKRRVH